MNKLERKIKEAKLEEAWYRKLMEYFQEQIKVLENLKKNETTKTTRRK